MQENDRVSIEDILQRTPVDESWMQIGRQTFTRLQESAYSLYHSVRDYIHNPQRLKKDAVRWGYAAGFSLLAVFASQNGRADNYLKETFDSPLLTQIENVQTGGGLSSTHSYASGADSVLGKGSVYQATLAENQGFTFYFNRGDWFQPDDNPRSVYWLEAWVGANGVEGMGFDVASANWDSISHAHLTADRGNKQRIGVLGFADDFPIGQATYSRTSSASNESTAKIVEFDDVSRTELPHFLDYLERQQRIPYIIGEEASIIAAGSPVESYKPGDVVFYPVANQMDIQLQPGEAQSLYFSPLRLNEPGYVLLNVRYETVNPDVQLALAQLEADDPIPGSGLPFSFTNQVNSQISSLRDGESSLDLYVVMHSRNMIVPLIQAVLSDDGLQQDAERETVVHVRCLEAYLLTDFEEYLEKERLGTYGDSPTATATPYIEVVTPTPSPTPSATPTPTSTPTRKPDEAPVFSTIEDLRYDEDSPALSQEILNIRRYLRDDNTPVDRLKLSVTDNHSDIESRIDDGGGLYLRDIPPGYHTISEPLRVSVQAKDERGNATEETFRIFVDAKPDANLTLENIAKPDESLFGSTIEIYGYRIDRPDKTYAAQVNVDGNRSIQFDGPGEYGLVTIVDGKHTRMQYLRVIDSKDFDGSVQCVPSYVDGEFVADILMREGKIVKPQYGNVFGMYAFFKTPDVTDEDIQFVYERAIQPVVDRLSDGKKVLKLDLSGERNGDSDYLQIWMAAPDPNTRDVGVLILNGNTAGSILLEGNVVVRGTAQSVAGWITPGLQEMLGIHGMHGENDKYFASVFGDVSGAENLNDPVDRYTIDIWKNMSSGGKIVKRDRDAYTFMDGGL